MTRTLKFFTAATLLCSPYHLIYALPLLFLSILLLFAGTLLTLDKTRTFAGSLEVKKDASFYRLESGIGGLAIGWVLAVHMTTLIALLILNYNETSHLSAPAFLVVWFLSAIVLALVCGRWKYAALVFGGILGGVCTGLILAISLHPSLLARLLLALIAVVMLTGGALLPIARHVLLRIATSATGAAGIINACAILGSSATNDKLASWTNAWLHLVLLHDSDSAELQWGNGKSKGLTAACYFLWMIGAACDWYLKRRVGQDSEAWNNVLESYTPIFPPEASRIGIFTSIESYWTSFKQKMRFSKIDTRAEKSIFFPSSSPPIPPPPKFHQNLKAPPVFRPRIPGAFTPDPYYSDSDSDLGDGENSSGRVPCERKWTVSTNHSYTNLVNPEGLRRQHGVDRSVKHPPIFITSPSRSDVEYGDKDAERSPELNLGPHRIELSRHNENWRPVFLKRSDSLKAEIVEVEGRDVTTIAPVALYSPDYQFGRPELAHRATPMHTLAEGSPSTPRLVPATPPLIKTLDSASRVQSRTYSGKLVGDESESDGSTREAPPGNRIDTHQDGDGAVAPRENDRKWGF